MIAERVQIPATAAGCREASEWLAQCAAVHGLTTDALQRLDLCLNEALANVIAHGGAAALSHPVSLSIAVQSTPEGFEAVVSIADQGVPFNPLSRAAKPRPEHLCDAEPGGLGIDMIRLNADALAYQYQQGRNELAVTVRWGCA